MQTLSKKILSQTVLIVTVNEMQKISIAFCLRYDERQLKLIFTV